MSTDPTPETARALLYRHGLPEDVIDGALCLHAQELAAAIRTTDLPDWHETVDMFDNGASWAADLIDPTVPDSLAGTANAVPAAGCVVSAAPTQADLRDRIAEALRPGSRDRSGQHPEGLMRDVDAVLSVLPPPADRGAEADRLREQLEEAEDTAEQLVRNAQTVARERESYRKAWKEEQQRRAKAERELRRVADEAQQPAVGARQPDTETPTADVFTAAELVAALRAAGDERDKVHAKELDALRAAEDPARIDRLRPEFFEHASVESIDSQIRRAQTQRRAWGDRERTLSILRQARVKQMELGEWPAASSAVPGRSAATDTGEETGRG